MKDNKQRIADQMLEIKMAKQQSRSILELSKRLVLEQSRQMMDIDPESLLIGDTPRVIDEWMLAESVELCLPVGFELVDQ